MSDTTPGPSAEPTPSSTAPWSGEASSLADNPTPSISASSTAPWSGEASSLADNPTPSISNPPSEAAGGEWSAAPTGGAWFTQLGNQVQTVGLNRAPWLMDLGTQQGVQTVGQAGGSWIDQPSGTSTTAAPTASVPSSPQNAYLLILPPVSPAGGASAAIAAASGIGSQDLSGQTAGNTGNSITNAAQADMVGTSGIRLNFMFNPKSYKIDKEGEWEHKKKSGAWPTAIPSWKGSSQRHLHVELFFDTTTSGWTSVQPYVDLLFACVQPTLPSLILEAPSPPFVMFGWGETLSFLAYMTKVDADFTMFKQDGTPVRVNCVIDLKEIPVGVAGQNPTSGGRARRTRSLVAGDSLQSIANGEYGKPTMWRAIASANGIEDPTRVRPGTTVLIPPKAEAAQLA